MARLEVSDPKLTSDFARMLAESGMPAPWGQPHEAGNVYDAEGVHILTVDPDCNRDSELVVQQADLLILAVNTCAGFKAVRADASEAS